MTGRRWIPLVVAVAVVAIAGVVAVVVVSRSGSRSPVSLALPGSMASAGDSITRAFDLDRQHLLQDDPDDSWSTGSDPTVDSQYDRVLAAHPAIAGHVYNDATTGAKMAALASQLQMAAAQQVAYVTVLLGANDLCTPSVAAMTPAATFEAQFQAALSAFLAADPTAHVFVASIPNVFQLWNTLRTDPAAEILWNLAHICPSMLSLRATTADRQAVVTRELADNAALASVCRQYAHCRFDGGAVYRVVFPAADVSTADYFHPSLSGQQALAAVTWGAGYWPATR